LTGHTENRENNRGRSMHGCKWQRGNEFHCSWDALFRPLTILECYNNAISRATDQPVFLHIDFNTCDVIALTLTLTQI
jgi:hypothetical protein